MPKTTANILRVIRNNLVNHNIDADFQRRLAQFLRRRGELVGVELEHDLEHDPLPVEISLVPQVKDMFSKVRVTESPATIDPVTPTRFSRVDKELFP